MSQIQTSVEYPEGRVRVLRTVPSYKRTSAGWYVIPFESDIDHYAT